MLVHLLTNITHAQDKEMCEGQDKADDCCGPKGGTSSFTQQVVRAIYAKWLSQARRATGYRRLFSMLAFLALLLGVLYAQRGSTAAFQVHSTLSSVVGLDGDAETMQTPDGVYSWLQGILQVCVGGGGQPCNCTHRSCVPFAT